ncbi:unnamed protein product [Penicillium olsonii]|uniref:Uncharacterized protein n=1 Tax=Penicillium olsonii TaxID=99116 RepID=A0A9W4I7S3_PENOL|nr:unnamed protein product [Penicillium olsonii]
MSKDYLPSMKTSKLLRLPSNMAVSPNRQGSLASYEDLETPYVRMIVEADKIPWEYNVLASSANWVLLAGYLVVPGTFTSLRNSDAVSDTLSQNSAGSAILNTIQNPPLLAISCVLFVIGTVIMGWLFRKHQFNYIWLTSRLFI